MTCGRPRNKLDRRRIGRPSHRFHATHEQKTLHALVNHAINTVYKTQYFTETVEARGLAKLKQRINVTKFFTDFNFSQFDHFFGFWVRYNFSMPRKLSGDHVI